MTVNLVSIREAPDSTALLYELMAQRTAEQNISHTALPSYRDHEEFVRYHPYRDWFVIVDPEHNIQVGALYLTKANEIGIFILNRYQRQGYARAAIQHAIDTIMPLPAVPGVRGSRWLANINPLNTPSIDLFRNLGFSQKQITLEKD